MSEQRAVPEIPEDLANLHSAATDDSAWGGRRVRTLIERIAQDRDWYLHQIKIVNGANATLTAERDALKQQLISMTADRNLWQDAHDEDCPNKAENASLTKWKNESIERLQDICDENGCPAGGNRFDFLQDLLRLRCKEISDLKAQVERLDWQPITPENLPNDGDEVIADDESVYAVEWKGMLPQYRHSACVNNGWTHFRPINAPARTAPAKETEQNGEHYV